MSTASDILAKLNAQIDARLSGAEEIQYPDGTRVRLASLESLLKARREIAGEVGAENQGGLYVRTATKGVR